MFTLLALAASLTLPTASSAPRLIETGSDQRSWMEEDQIHAISHKNHEKGRCGGYIDVTNYQDDLRPTPKESQVFFESQSVRNDSRIDELLPKLEADRIYKTVEFLSSYPTRYYDSDKGVEAAMWIADQFKAIASSRSDISVKLFEHKEWKQPSVIARIEGSKNPDEIVVIGGHEDSVNQGFFGPRPSAAAPGADDNASGIATILETFRVLVEADYKPERTIEFMAYAGEEAGLLGSMEIASAYRKDSKNVVGVMQLDMTMYPGPNDNIMIITDETDKGLNNFLVDVITSYVKSPLEKSICDYACSDHASWTKYGYASVFPTEGDTSDDNPRIHSKRDTIEILDSAFGLAFAKTALAFAVELAR